MIPIKGMVHKLPTVQLTNANLLTYKIVSKLVSIRHKFLEGADGVQDFLQITDELDCVGVEKD